MTEVLRCSVCGKAQVVEEAGIKERVSRPEGKAGVYICPTCQAKIEGEARHYQKGELKGQPKM